MPTQLAYTQPTRVGSVIINGLESTSPYVSSFVVEVYSDSGLTQLVAKKSSPSFWNGTLNSQLDTMTFSGLPLGNTYWLRAGTCSPQSTVTSWSAPYSVNLGSVEALEGITYGGSYTATSSGASYIVRPTYAPADIDHYESIYTINTTTIPASNVVPAWKGIADSSGLITFGSIGAPGQVLRAYMRAVNTAGNVQQWKLISTLTVSAVGGVGTLDAVPDGNTYARMLATGLLAGVPDPRQSTGLLKLGAVNPAWSGSLFWSATASGATSAQILFWWDQLVVKRTDGTQTVVGARPQSNPVVINNLNASASGSPAVVYDIYPYIDDVLNVVGFLNGGTGFPTYAYLDANLTQDSATTNSQLMNRQDRLGLGPIQISMPIYSGTTATSGGGGGFGGTCPRGDMKVFVERYGRVPASYIQPGDRLMTTPEFGDWIKVLNVRHEVWSDWIEVNTTKGQVLVHPHTHFPVDGLEDCITAKDLTLSHLLKSRNGLARITGIRHIQEEGTRVILTCDGSKVFLCGTTYPDIVIHNVRLLNC